MSEPDSDSTLEDIVLFTVLFTFNFVSEKGRESLLLLASSPLGGRLRPENSAVEGDELVLLGDFRFSDASVARLDPP